MANVVVMSPGDVDSTKRENGDPDDVEKRLSPERSMPLSMANDENCPHGLFALPLAFTKPPSWPRRNLPWPM